MILQTLFAAFLLLDTMVDSRPRSKPYVRGCYYTNWAQYRPDPWKFVPENYEPGLCTHLFYAFVVMKEDFTLKPFEWNDEDSDGRPGMYRRVLNLKQKQSDLKLLLSFAGYTFSQNNAALLRRMATNPQNRRVFIDSVISFVRRIGFDGFDVDWEYPGWDTKSAYTALIREMREAFEQESRNSGRPRLLLTAAVAAGIEQINAGYNGRAIADSFDYINVMAYDFHGAWEMKTGFNAPLLDRNNDRLSVSSAMTYWYKNQGIPKDKLLVGFGTYGRGWTLSSSSTEVGSSASGPSPAQTYTREAGIASYYEACDMLEQKRFTTHFDSVQRVPYMYKDNLWFGYDDVRSFHEKLQWLIDNGFGGAFVWALDMDDFLGRCSSSGGKKYPLISAIRDKLDGDGIDDPNSPTESPIRSSAPPATDPIARSTPRGPTSPTGPFKCPEPGLYPDPSSCTTFFHCDEAGTAHRKNCPPGLHFSKEDLLCNWPHLAGCDQ